MFGKEKVSDPHDEEWYVERHETEGNHQEDGGELQPHQRLLGQNPGLFLLPFSGKQSVDDEEVHHGNDGQRYQGDQQPVYAIQDERYEAVGGICRTEFIPRSTDEDSAQKWFIQNKYHGG